jgi:hypothetical protein
MKLHNELTAWDRLGISLSLLCLAHCLVTPFVILSLPLLGRYYLTHPYFHWALAHLVVPVGVFAFLRGYRHHGQILIFVTGLVGLFLVGLMPVILDALQVRGPETFFVSLGSVLLVTAHWKNQRSCSCAIHHHP